MVCFINQVALTNALSVHKEEDLSENFIHLVKPASNENSN